MDGREGMALQGSAPYYMHRAIPGSVGSGAGQPGLNTPSSGFRPSSNPNISSQQIVRANNSVGPGFNVEGSQPNVPQGFTITVASIGGSLSEPTKKKRGRPRKYGPDGSGPGAASVSGTMALGLSPSTPNSSALAERKKRGRPPGSGRKQRLASVGDWMNNSAGIAFMPHVIHVAPGEDVASKILSFSQQRPRALCIMSGSGGVSAVTLRQPGSATGTVSFEGRFEILCLSGSYLVAETGGSRNRTGGVNVSLSSPDGHVIGGAVGGRLVASKAVQVVVCSFVYGNPKGKESDSMDDKSSEQLLSDKSSAQINNASSSQNVPGSWPGSKGIDLKNPNTDIDLASG
ncbi:AT-hook motif nuclear-localized protein 5-like [Chenopodium quinoa]|uniref:AT-hook motif nuclear-localized protein n=1 Tax=Chenopodium quinoa TaxID=63459 RepID=A0A803LQI5_CHEQI|nr:AT-hook motif nuclear-localized protein 5-like [Chenopodium quinoa]